MKITATKYRLNPDRIRAGTRGSYGIEKIELVFSPEWDGLTKKIVFHPVRGRPVEISYLGGEIDIPPEVMRHSGETRFVVSGVLNSGDVVEKKIVSLTGVIEVEHTQDDRGGNSVPITPDNFNLFVAAAEERIEEKLTEAKESGEFDGPPGPAMIYDDLTDDQKEALRGEPGDPGVFVRESADDAAPDSANVMVDMTEEEDEPEIWIPDGMIREGNLIWMVCDGAKVGEPFEIIDGVDGKDGKNFTILGYYDSFAELEAAVTTPKPGDAYGVGTESPYTAYVWDGVTFSWKDNGALSGVAGADGKDGVGIASVVQTTTSTADGGTNIITVTDTSGKTYKFEVKNGSKGSAGYTPQKGTDYNDGYTPVRGKDYWTDADQKGILESIKDYFADKCMSKSVLVPAVIGTAWEGDSAPYTQTITADDVTADAVLEIFLPSTATEEQVSAYNALMLQDGGQTDGSFTLRAFGKINSVTIPINIIVRREL